MDPGITYHAALCSSVILSDLRDPLERAILGTEVDDGGPVVGQILGELASRAGGLLDEIMCLDVHRGVERVLWVVSCKSRWRSQVPGFRETYASDNLMKMTRRVRTRIHQRVQTLDGELGAWES